jgi:hypothetical protein
MFPRSPTSRLCRRLVPPEFGSPAWPAAPDRNTAQQNAGTARLAAPADNRNFSRSCSDWGARPHLRSRARRRNGASPTPRRKAASRTPRRKAASPAWRSSAGRSRVTTDGPPSMTSRRAPSTCPTEHDWKPIRAWATGWTIPVTWANACAGPRRPTSMNWSRGRRPSRGAGVAPHTHRRQRHLRTGGTARSPLHAWPERRFQWMRVVQGLRRLPAGLSERTS